MRLLFAFHALQHVPRLRQAGHGRVREKRKADAATPSFHLRRTFGLDGKRVRMETTEILIPALLCAVPFDVAA